MGFQKSNFY